MDATALIIMIIVGAVAGWLATALVGGLKFGLLGTIIVGIVGGFVGGWLLNALKINFNLGSPIVNSIVVSAIGAIVLIVIGRLLGL
jgi:uncharacterized membrane protein YeaQ/YmgE (transglycosylase-associated protein family)